ncbi:MAG TPA: ABC transporter permease [Longimicrobiaceae bacterium]|nr:ABC transporter permease [Longimicrobiaceae bacterium]
MDTLLQDIRYAFRRLRRSPGFAVVAILTLALGIGTNSALFSVVNAVLLRSLPYADAERLVLVAHVTDTGDRAPMSPANFRDVREEVRSLEELSFWAYSSPTLTGVGDPVRLDGAGVGAHFFEVMKAAPLLGWTFRPDENEPGRNRVAVLGHGAWRQRRRDRAAVCAGSPPLSTVVSCFTEPQPDPGAAGGTPEPAVHAVENQSRAAPQRPRLMR